MNKIEGTPILKLAMVKRLKVKKNLLQNQSSSKGSPKKLSMVQCIHTIGISPYKKKAKRNRKKQKETKRNKKKQKETKRNKKKQKEQHLLTITSK